MRPLLGVCGHLRRQAGSLPVKQKDPIQNEREKKNIAKVEEKHSSKIRRRSIRWKDYISKVESK